MDAAVHDAQPHQPFLDDRARSLAQRRGDRGDLATYAGAGRIRGRAGGRQRVGVPQTTWMTCDGRIRQAIVCAECSLNMTLQLSAPVNIRRAKSNAQDLPAPKWRMWYRPCVD